MHHLILPSPKEKDLKHPNVENLQKQKLSFYSEWRCRKKSAWPHKPLQEAENALENEGAVRWHRAEGGL